MLELSNELVVHLNHGGTIIVPTRQRVAAMRVAHTAAQLAAGHHSWNSPDVLSWSGWLERTLDAARAQRRGAPRRLSSSEEWLCWRTAVRAAGTDAAVLFADGLVDSVRRAVTLLDDYALPLSSAVSAESRLLLDARRLFREHCVERHTIGTTSWQDCAPHLMPVTATRLVGFASLGPARRRWLGSLGVQIDESAAEPMRKTVLQSYADPEAEAAAAAEWCAQLLTAAPSARALLVVPRLAEQSARWQRALAERLEYRAILEPGAAAAPVAFAIEGGSALRSFPLLASALDLIALSVGNADFSTLSALLRAPYFGKLDAVARLRVDLWLREHNVDTAEPALLRGLLPALEAAAGAAATGVLRDLLSDAATGQSEARNTASPAHWAARFAQRLAACGWPGAGLSSPEQQVRTRFDELLNDFAALAAEPYHCTVRQAATLLEALAGRSAFEPASDDVPVTLTASLDDPIVRYDGIWVAGLTADTWPAPAQPDPLIPMALQLAAGMPAATTAGQRQLAIAALGGWDRAGVRPRWSWARSEGDLECSASPLLGQYAALGGSEVDGEAPFLLESALAAAAPQLESWSDSSVPRQVGSGALRGGARLLELQSLCPFRSFAELRLGARPLPEPMPGIDARARGRILHRALELFWQELRNSAALQQRNEESAGQLARRCVARALQEAQAELPGLLSPRLLENEGARAEHLLRVLREWERRRAPFSIEALEWAVPLELVGATLRMRLDRVDVLSDGARIVIDYKSGTAGPFEPEALRPSQPQLPAYALAAGAATRGVLALQLAPDGLTVRGVTDESERIHGLKATLSAQPDWSALQQHWRHTIGSLLQEFLNGEARVAPQPGVCAHCHLALLCRIEHPRRGGAA